MFYVLVYPQGRYKWSIKQANDIFWKLSAYIAGDEGRISSRLKNYGFSEKKLSRDLKLPKPPKFNRKFNVPTNRLTFGVWHYLSFRDFFSEKNSLKTPKICSFQYIFTIGLYMENYKIWFLWLILYGFDLYRPPKGN